MLIQNHYRLELKWKLKKPYEYTIDGISLPSGSLCHIEREEVNAMQLLLLFNSALTLNLTQNGNVQWMFSGVS